MHAEQNAEITTSRSLFSPYIAGWAVMAIAAIGYIGWVATHADQLALTPPAAPPPQGESNEGQRAMSDALAEVKALKDTVGEVQRDVAQLKSDVASSGERNQKLLDRVAALEEKPGNAPATVSAPSAPVAGPATAASAAPAPQPPKSADAKPPVLPKVLNATPEPPKALETGSVAAASIAAAAQAPVVFGPAIVKPAPKQVGIQIATGPSVDSLRLSWSLLTDRHADSLKNLEPRYVAGSDAGGASFDLVAGPIKSAAEAKRVCAALAAKDVPCRVGDFKGDAL